VQPGESPERVRTSDQVELTSNTPY
jgi:hypothetical protein